MKIEMIEIIVGIVLICTVPLLFKTGTHSKEYPQTMVVAQIDEPVDSVTIETATGYQYSFLGIEDYEVGDVVAVTMDDNATETIEDDKVVSVRFSGYVKGDVE